MHGRCLELLAPPLLAKAQAKVLDVGSGSGYLTAAFALLGPGIEAYGVDRDAGLVALSIKNVAKDNLLQKELGDRVRFERRDCWTGLPDCSIAAKILVSTCSISTVSKSTTAASSRVFSSLELVNIHAPSIASSATCRQSESRDPLSTSLARPARLAA